MHTLKTHFLLLTCSVVAVVLLSGCNVQGLFTNLGDDPKWIEPKQDKRHPGEVVFVGKCAVCHQSTGLGDLGKGFPPLAGSAIATGDPRKPMAIVLHGFSGKIVRKGVEINNAMPAWKDILSDQEIADVLTYVRKSFGNKADSVAPDAVAAMRTETAARANAYTEAELP